MGVPGEPRNLKRAYASACTLCKSARKKCVWPEEDAASVACVPCVRKGLQCPGSPPPPPSKRRLLSESPSDATSSASSSSSSALSIRPSSTSSRFSSLAIAEILSQQLLDIYTSHWLISPIGPELEHRFRAIGGKVDELDVPSRSLYLSALALAARSSSHPAISGPRAPSLEFVDSEEAENIDLSDYGVARRGPCDVLARQAIDAFVEPGVAQSDLGMRASLLAIYLFAALDGELSRTALEAAAAVFRQTRVLELTPETYETWSMTGKGLFLVDAASACVSASQPLFSDREVSALIPRPPTFVFAPDFNLFDFISNCEESYPYGMYFKDCFDTNTDSRVWLSRDIANILSSSPKLIPSNLPSLTTIWEAFDTASLLSSNARSLALILRSEVEASGMNSEAILRADFLIANLPPIIGRVLLLQFPIHAVVTAWAAAGTLKDSVVLEECVKQTRRSIKFLAATFHDYNLIPRSKSVPISQSFLRIECVVDWVEVALERLPVERRAEEVSLEELGWLIGGMRRAGWSYGRAKIRLRELEQGVVALRQAVFDSQMEEKDFLTEYLDMASL